MGVLLAAALSGPAAAAAQEVPGVIVSAEGVRLDFQNAELRLVISALAEAGGLNLVYGELPNRRITLRIADPIPVDGIRTLLEQVASANGLVVEQAEGVLSVGIAQPLAAEQADPGRGRPEVTDAGQLHIYRLRHVPAGRLAATLQALFGGRPGGAPGFAGRDRGPDQNIQPTELSVQPRSEMEAVLDSRVATVSLPVALESDVQIVPDELTNSILVRSSPGDWEVLRAAIEALDLRPLQVLIEVLIAEVRRDRTFDVGLRATTPSSSDDDGTVTFEDRIGAALLGESVGDLLLQLRDIGELDIDLAVSALAANGRVRVLSRPVLLAQNNLEARILVGSERPFVQVFRSLPTESAARDQIVQYRDVGTQLTILPTINPDGYVNLAIAQEVSNATSESQFGAPVISTREATTNLFVRDGATAVIGGLIDHQTERTRSGIPLLKDIPLLGWLFGSTRDKQVETELFLFMTPHIIRSDDDLDRLERQIEERAPDIAEGAESNGPVILPANALPEASDEADDS